MTAVKGRRENGRGSFVRSLPVEEGFVQSEAGFETDKNGLSVPIGSASTEDSRTFSERTHNEFEKGPRIS